MSDLSDELNEIGSTLNHWPAIVKAARRVVNPDIEAGVKAYIEKWNELAPRTNTKECFQAGFNAALGITEDE